MKPPENVLFVCKLNSVTDDEDLQLIFSRFDPEAKAEIIRDPITGDSLQYAFIEFATKEQCTEAYFKMNNALIDDRRIKVDFSQSVAKVWNKYAKRRRMNGNGTDRVEHVSRDQQKKSNGILDRAPANSIRHGGLSERGRSGDRLRGEAESTRDISRNRERSHSPSSRSQSTATGSTYSSREKRSRNGKKRRRKYRDDNHRRSRDHRHHRRDDDERRRHNSEKRRRHRHRLDEETADVDNQSRTDRHWRSRSTATVEHRDRSEKRRKALHRNLDWKSRRR